MVPKINFNANDPNRGRGGDQGRGFWRARLPRSEKWRTARALATCTAFAAPTAMRSLTLFVTANHPFHPGICEKASTGTKAARQCRMSGKLRRHNSASWTRQYSCRVCRFSALVPSGTQIVDLGSRKFCGALPQCQAGLSSNVLCQHEAAQHRFEVTLVAKFSPLSRSRTFGCMSTSCGKSLTPASSVASHAL